MNWKDEINFEELLKFWIVDPEITNLFKEYGVPMAAEKIETLKDVGLPREKIYYAIEIKM